MEKESKIKRTPWIFLCLIALVFSIFVNVHLWNQNSDLTSRNKELQRSLSTAEATRDNYKALMDRSDKKLAKISEEYSFYQNHAVIVTETGYRYHRYSCPHLNFDSFWIYNTKNAQAQGYTPCLDCDPPQ